MRERLWPAFHMITELPGLRFNVARNYDFDDVKPQNENTFLEDSIDKQIVNVTIKYDANLRPFASF